jgi:hypothetical protein
MSRFLTSTSRPPRSSPLPSTTPSSSSSSSRLSTNANDRLRFLVEALTKPLQLPILNQQRLEHHTSTSSSLSSTSSLLRSQARLKPGYIDWDDGLSQIKSFVRDNPQAPPLVFTLLTERMRVKSSESRLLSLYLIDSLFTRSAKFRALTLDSLHSLLELCLGLTSSSTSSTPTLTPLPGSTEAAEQLREECVRIVGEWNGKYGGVYRVLTLGYKWMMDAMGREDEVTRGRRVEEEKRVEEKKEAEMLRVRFDKVREEWKEKRVEVEQCIATVEGCMAMLFPPEEDWVEMAVNERKEEQVRVDEQVIVDRADDGDGVIEGSDVEWEEDDEIGQADGSNAGHPPAPSEVSGEGDEVKDSKGEDEDGSESADWADEYLRSGGSGEVWGDEAVQDDDEGGGEGEVDDVNRVVTEAGLGSRSYQLDIDFDTNFGHMENEGQRQAITHPPPTDIQQRTARSRSCLVVLMCDADNAAVFETLRDCCRMIQKTYLPLVSTVSVISTPLSSRADLTSFPPPSPSSLFRQLNEWKDVVQTVRVRPPPSSIPTSSTDDRLIHTAFLERERSTLSTSISQLLTHLHTQLTQLAQLNIHTQRRSTLLTQLTQPLHNPSVEQSKGQEGKDEGFFSALRQRRRKAVKRVEKYTRKRSRPTEKVMDKPSDIHKRIKRGQQ